MTASKQVIPIILGLLALIHSAPGGAEQSVRPGINDHYQKPAFEQWRRTFERPGREVWDRRREVVKALDLKPGMAVADLGAGTGFHALLMAEEVGSEGKVYAIDIADYFVEGTLARAREAGLHQVEGIINAENSTDLPPASVDLLFSSATYHHLEYPESVLASAHAALRPGGEMVIVDFRKHPTVASGWVKSHVRLDRAEVIAEVEEAGFRFVDEPLKLDQFFMLRFERIGLH